jgi:tRNA (adenine22-N1)-methyltransferase
MITPRLQKIIDLVDEKIIADIGTDHAYIPIRLSSLGKISKAIATDKNKGPLEIAKNNVIKYGFDNIIETRLGEGLEPIEAGECELVIIAGMGGKLIGDIILKDLKKSETFKFLLQPMNAQAELRERLIKNGFKITKEELSSEGFKVYNVFLCEKGEQKLPPNINLHIPKELESHKLYNMLINKKIREFEKIIKGIKNAKEPDFAALAEFSELLEDIKLLSGRN